ncbi:ccaat-box dna-binding subunit related protein [Cystoisospora suis]|uniref:Ccaat-box dna-binding subunit related protein n=1 Tax=Cystoisospora suis TaxID=483139 RepID=A0A2C6KIQ7_9APIC|nr:ccaat-box dna-binding subunit related protein [Cystoisospora suis]
MLEDEKGEEDEEEHALDEEGDDLYLFDKENIGEEDEEEQEENKSMLKRKERYEEEEEAATRRLKMIGEKYLNAEEVVDHEGKERRRDLNEVEEGGGIAGGDYFDDDFSSSSSDFFSSAGGGAAVAGAACDTSVLFGDTLSLQERQSLSEEGQENYKSRENLPSFSDGRDCFISSYSSFEDPRKRSEVHLLSSVKDPTNSRARRGEEEGGKLSRAHLQHDIDRLFHHPGGGVYTPGGGGGGVIGSDFSGDLSTRKSFFDSYPKSSHSSMLKKKALSLLSKEGEGGDFSLQDNCKISSSSSLSLSSANLKKGEKQQKRHQTLLSLLDPFNVDMTDLDSKSPAFPLANKLQPYVPRPAENVSVASDFTSSPFSPWSSQHLLALALNPFKEIRMRKASSYLTRSTSSSSFYLHDSDDEDHEARWSEGEEGRGRRGSLSMTDRERMKRQGQKHSHEGGCEWEAEIIDAFDDSGFHDDIWLMRDQAEHGRDACRGGEGEEEEEADAVIQDFLEGGMTGAGLRDHEKGMRVNSSHLSSSSSSTAGEPSSGSASSSTLGGLAHTATGKGVEVGMFTSVYNPDRKDTNQAASYIARLLEGGDSSSSSFASSGLSQFFPGGGEAGASLALGGMTLLEEPQKVKSRFTPHSCACRDIHTYVDM